MLNNGGYY
jgi:uncharacterized membrane protein